MNLSSIRFGYYHIHPYYEFGRLCIWLHQRDSLCGGGVASAATRYLARSVISVAAKTLARSLFSLVLSRFCSLVLYFSIHIYVDCRPPPATLCPQPLPIDIKLDACDCESEDMTSTTWRSGAVAGCELQRGGITGSTGRGGKGSLWSTVPTYINNDGQQCLPILTIEASLEWGMLQLQMSE